MSHIKKGMAILVEVQDFEPLPKWPFPFYWQS